MNNNFINRIKALELSDNDYNMVIAAFEATEELTGCDHNIICGSCRKKEYVEARMILGYYLYSNLEFVYKRNMVGSIMNKCHSTIWYYSYVIDDIVKSYDLPMYSSINENIEVFNENVSNRINKL